MKTQWTTGELGNFIPIKQFAHIYYSNGLFTPKLKSSGTEYKQTKHRLAAKFGALVWMCARQSW